ALALTAAPPPRCRRLRSRRNASAWRQVSDHQPRSPRLYAKPSGETMPLRSSVQPRHSVRKAPRSTDRSRRSSFTADQGTREIPRSQALTEDTEHPRSSAHALTLNRHECRSSRNPSGLMCHTRRRGAEPDRGDLKEGRPTEPQSPLIDANAYCVKL